MRQFTFARTPALRFGAGSFNELPDILAQYGSSALILTGRHSFAKSGRRDRLVSRCAELDMAVEFETVHGEPSPELVDDLVHQYRDRRFAAVCAIGGGSVLDAGKAIAAMLADDGSVVDVLEGIGSRAPSGKTLPLVAVPTTAGTGSEATKNAVLSRVGPDGFKKSLRHDNYVPAVALIDSEFALDCPPGVTAASGLDAFTQLLESYVSTTANPLTDALAMSGLEHVGPNVFPSATTACNNIDVRAAMAYGAYLSGVTLANAGLGVVHGFASSIGGRYPIPHGVICGSLLGAAVRVTVDRLRRQGEQGASALARYARVGELVSGERCWDTAHCCDALIWTIDEWIGGLGIPRLGSFGIGESDVSPIVAATGAKNNPGNLSADDMTEILLMRL